MGEYAGEKWFIFLSVLGAVVWDQGVFGKEWQ